AVSVVAKNCRFEAAVVGVGPRFVAKVHAGKDDNTAVRQDGTGDGAIACRTGEHRKRDLANAIESGVQAAIDIELGYAKCRGITWIRGVDQVQVLPAAEQHAAVRANDTVIPDVGSQIHGRTAITDWSAIGC